MRYSRCVAQIIGLIATITMTISYAYTPWYRFITNQSSDTWTISFTLRSDDEADAYFDNIKDVRSQGHLSCSNLINNPYSSHHFCELPPNTMTYVLYSGVYDQLFKTKLGEITLVNKVQNLHIIHSFGQDGRDFWLHSSNARYSNDNSGDICIGDRMLGLCRGYH